MWLAWFGTRFCACSYGSTADGKLVDAAGLQLLESMGFDRAVAAEALKQVQHHILPAVNCGFIKAKSQSVPRVWFS